MSWILLWFAVRARRGGLMGALALTLVGCGGGGGGEAPAPATPPSITSQPASQTVTAPATATFTVSASGATSYQWRRNGTDIAGATAASYTTPATVPTDNGASFTVLVSNAHGSVQSSAAILNVAAPPPGALTNETLVHDSLTRTYLKHTPQSMPATAVPLVIVLHGGAEGAATAASAARATARWRDIADLEKFVLVYPDAVDNNWRDCRSDATILGSANDVGFLAALIDKIAAERAIDTARVYITGVSNGGLMSYRMALELSSRIAGIGAVIANMAVDPLRICGMAPQPLAVVIMNGTADGLMPFAGGNVSPGTDRGTVQSAPSSRDYWATVNGCAAAPTVESLPDLDPNDASTVVKQTYSNCSSGKPVVFFRIDGGGHFMPSRIFLNAGRQNRDIEGADEIWRVLKNVRR